MPATLKDTDWKAVLNKPKNAGLKAFGGTGIGKKLEEVKEALKKFNEDHVNIPNHNALIKAYADLMAQCAAVVSKHEKLYTEACTYLKQVKDLAKHEHDAEAARVAEVAARKQVQSSLQAYWSELKSVKGNAAIRTFLAKVLKLFVDNKGAWAACATGETKMRVAMSKLDGIEEFGQIRGHDVDKVFLEMIQSASKS